MGYYGQKQCITYKVELQISYAEIQKKVFYYQKSKVIVEILRTGCEWTKYIKAKVYPEHIHILVEILPKISVWNFIGYLKGKSSRMLYEQFRK